MWLMHRDSLVRNQLNVQRMYSNLSGCHCCCDVNHKASEVHWASRGRAAGPRAYVQQEMDGVMQNALLHNAVQYKSTTNDILGLRE